MLLNLYKNIFKKLILFVVSTSYCSICLSQQIEPGKYVSVWMYDPIKHETVYSGDYREEIAILDSLHFSYRYSDDVADERGIGIYRQEKKILHLDFKDMTIHHDTSNYVIIDSSITNKDSIRVKFKIQDKKQVLQGARIEYNGTENSQKTGSNNNGIATIWVSLNNLPGFFRVTYVGYEQVFINLNGPYNKVIQVNMDTYYNSIPKGKTLTYQIKEVDTDGFYAKGGTFSDWTFFKKVE